jgi:hypothetical protein
MRYELATNKMTTNHIEFELTVVKKLRPETTNAAIYGTQKYHEKKNKR